MWAITFRYLLLMYAFLWTLQPCHIHSVLCGQQNCNALIKVISENLWCSVELQRVVHEEELVDVDFKKSDKRADIVVAVWDAVCQLEDLRARQGHYMYRQAGSASYPPSIIY